MMLSESKRRLKTLLFMISLVALVPIAGALAASVVSGHSPASAASGATTPALTPTQQTAQIRSALATAIAATGYNTVPRAASAPAMAPLVASCWRCTMAPAAALAARYLANGNPADLTLAVRATDAGLPAQVANGSFSPATGGGSHDIDTMFFAAQLGATYEVLRPYLDAAHQASWTKALTRAADYLSANGNINYYSNGNLNIGNVAVFAAAWKASGLVAYQNMMNAALTFALSPPQGRWPGQGFITTKAPTRADGSDGAGYFTETAGAVTGFDPDYTQLQATQATRVFQLTGDPRALKVLNMLVNQLLTRTDVSNFHLDVSGGSRHPAAGEWRWFSTAALSTLVWHGGRADLAQYLPLQLAAIANNFTDTSQYAQPGTWYNVGANLAAAIFDAPGNTLASGTFLSK